MGKKYAKVEAPAEAIRERKERGETYRQIAKGRIMFNPCKKIDPPKKERHKVVILQPEKVERMLKLLESTPLTWRA